MQWQQWIHHKFQRCLQVDITKAVVDKAKMEGFDTVLSDTACRQVIDTDLMDELQGIQTSGMCFVF